MAGLKKSTENINNLDKVVDQIEENAYRTLDDEIEIAEDGYVHDVPLLAGYTDKNGVHHTTFTYREMNGKDEEAISKAEVRQNGAKLVNTLCERCVVAIGTLTKKECGAEWGKIIREMLGGDLDYMAFKIRELSKGKEIEFSHKCPSCGSKLTTIVNTDEFELKPFMGSFEVEFSLIRGYRDAKGGIHKEGRMRLANGFDRELVTPLFRKNVSTATTMLLTRLISFNDGAYVSQSLVSEMSLRDRDVLEKLLESHSFGIDTSVDVVCSTCGADISGEAGQSNFL